MRKKTRIKKSVLKMNTIMIIMIPIAIVTIVLSKASLSNMNLEVEKLKRNITIQKNTNESLTMKVNELKSLANVDLVAENEGLSYNSNNIIVISN